MPLGVTSSSHGFKTYLQGKVFAFSSHKYKEGTNTSLIL